MSLRRLRSREASMRLREVYRTSSKADPTRQSPRRPVEGESKRESATLTQSMTTEEEEWNACRYELRIFLIAVLSTHFDGCLDIGN